METTTNSLQEIIEKRAEKKLKNDLLSLYDTISGNRILTGNGVPTLTIKKDEKVFEQRLTNLLLVRTSQDYDFKKQIDVQGIYSNELFKHWLPIYIQEETNAFINKVDSLQEQIEELKTDKYEEF